MPLLGRTATLDASVHVEGHNLPAASLFPAAGDRRSLATERCVSMTGVLKAVRAAQMTRKPEFPIISKRSERPP